MRAWVRRARVGGEVIIGRLPQGKKLRSIRCAANVVNDDYRFEGKDIFVHVHFDWTTQVLVAIATTASELKDPNNAEKWKEQIPDAYASRMVFCVEKFSTLLASCCRVEVVKGRGAFLMRSPFLTSLT